MTGFARRLLGKSKLIDCSHRAPREKIPAVRTRRTKSRCPISSVCSTYFLTDAKNE